MVLVHRRGETIIKISLDYFHRNMSSRARDWIALHLLKFACTYYYKVILISNYNPQQIEFRKYNKIDKVILWSTVFFCVDIIRTYWLLLQVTTEQVFVLFV